MLSKEIESKTEKIKFELNPSSQAFLFSSVGTEHSGVILLRQREFSMFSAQSLKQMFLLNKMCFCDFEKLCYVQFSFLVHVNHVNQSLLIDMPVVIFPHHEDFALKQNFSFLFNTQPTTANSGNLQKLRLTDQH